MSETSFTPVISQELQATVRDNPRIDKVYFDADNRHYFYVHTLRSEPKDTDKNNWKQYGSGLFSHAEVIPGISNVDKKKEAVSKGDPKTLIVATLSRLEILTAITSLIPMEAATYQPMYQAPQQQLSPETMTMLQKISTGELAVVSKQDIDDAVAKAVAATLNKATSTDDDEEEDDDK